jgi:hypothetical protein
MLTDSDLFPSLFQIPKRKHQATVKHTTETQKSSSTTQKTNVLKVRKLLGIFSGR